MTAEERMRFLHGEWKVYLLHDILLLPIYAILFVQGFPKTSSASGQA